MGHKNKYNKNVDEHVYLIDFFYSSIRELSKNPTSLLKNHL